MKSILTQREAAKILTSLRKAGHDELADDLEVAVLNVSAFQDPDCIGTKLYHGDQALAQFYNDHVLVRGMYPTFKEFDLRVSKVGFAKATEYCYSLHIGTLSICPQ